MVVLFITHYNMLKNELIEKLQSISWNFSVVISLWDNIGAKKIKSVEEWELFIPEPNEDWTNWIHTIIIEIH